MTLVSLLQQREARGIFLWALLHGVRSGRMSSGSVQLILAAVACTHALAVGVAESQQWFMQRQEASCVVVTVQVLRYMQAGLLPTEVALLVHKELPCDLSDVRLNCTLPALMMQQQQQEERVDEFGLLCAYTAEILVCLALLHARDKQQFAAACLHQAYFTIGTALRSASAASASASSSGTPSPIYSTYSRIMGVGGVLREGYGGGIMCADDVVGLYSIELQVRLLVVMMIRATAAATNAISWQMNHNIEYIL